MFNTTAWLQYPLKRRMGSLQSQSGSFRENINLLPLPGFELQTVQHVA
jgi:hypothetical protein